MRRALLLVLALFVPVAGFGQKRPITEKDLFDFVWIGDMQMSPVSSTLAFVQTTVSADRSGYETSLYLLDTAAAGARPVRLTMGPHDSSPRWSPDGTHLAFVRAPGTGPAQVYLTTPDPKASPIRLTELPKGAGGPKWAPNGAGLVVTSSTPQDQARSKADGAKKARATGDEAHVSDVRIVNRAIYRFNGEGNLDPSFVSQLYYVSRVAPDGTQAPAVQLTEGRFGVADFAWKPGSEWLLYTSVHEDEPYYEPLVHNTLFAVELPAKGAKGVPPVHPWPY